MTIGVLSYEQAFEHSQDPRTAGSSVDVYSAYVHELQERWPYNLANPSDLIKAQQSEQPEDTQKSGLVRVF